MPLTDKLADEIVQQPGSDHASLDEAVLPHCGGVVDTLSLLERQATDSAPTPAHTKRAEGVSSLSRTNRHAWPPSVKPHGW